MTMRPKAYSYLRFSTPEQAKGDSFRRQSKAAEEYAARKGLDLDRSLTFEDPGVSAYRGANAETGKLGDFRRAVEDGLVQAGSYLLVESLDRISRSAARKALTLLGDIADLGITIVTLNDGREYTADSLNNDPISLLVALVTFIRANEESATKGMRVKASWNAKRGRALEKPLTSRTPAWITLNKATGKLELVPERAAVVVRIFQMLRDGAGQHRVAETLNRQGVPTFGDTGTSRKAALWHRSYIAKISRNPAVIGVFVPFVVENDASGNKVRRALPPIEGYYPAAVDPATRRERRRDYMREFMRRKRAATKNGRSPCDIASRPVSSNQDVSACVNSRVSSPTEARFAHYTPPPTGLTPLIKIRAKKVWRLTTSPAEPQASKDAARRHFAEIAERAGVTPAELLTAVGVAA